MVFDDCFGKKKAHEAREERLKEALTEVTHTLQEINDRLQLLQATVASKNTSDISAEMRQIRGILDRFEEFIKHGP